MKVKDQHGCAHGIMYLWKNTDNLTISDWEGHWQNLKLSYKIFEVVVTAICSKMTNYITNSTLKRTFQVVRILGRSSVSDIGRFSNVDSLRLNGYTPGLTSVRYKSSTNDKSKDIASILGPVNVKLNADKDGVNIGAELTGKLEQGIYVLYSYRQPCRING